MKFDILIDRGEHAHRFVFTLADAAYTIGALITFAATGVLLALGS